MQVLIDMDICCCLYEILLLLSYLLQLLSENPHFNISAFCILKYGAFWDSFQYSSSSLVFHNHNLTEQVVLAFFKEALIGKLCFNMGKLETETKTRNSSRSHNRSFIPQKNISSGIKLVKL